MKITTFNPLIVTKDAENIIKLFEALGFERRHSLDAKTGDDNLTSVRMKNADGFHVDIAQVEGYSRDSDMTLIRMNVDNFEEAYEFLISKGFMCPSGGVAVETKTNKSCSMISPSGFAFDLCQHIKD
jgi:hypothetical protein